MSEKKTMAEGLLTLVRENEVLAGIFDKIRILSPETDIWIFDARQGRRFRWESVGSSPVISSGSSDPGREWAVRLIAEGKKPPAQIILGNRHTMAVSVSVYGKGIYEGELTAAPVYAESGLLYSFAEKNPDCRILYDPNLDGSFEKPGRDTQDDGEARIKKVFYLMRGVKRYLESRLRRINVQMESDLVKSNYANAEQEYQEMSALADSIRNTQTVPMPGEEIVDHIFLMQKQTSSAAGDSDAARMERDLMRMRLILAKWQKKTCPIRIEMEFADLYLRVLGNMQRRHIETEFRIQKECLDLEIPFGTIHVLIKLAVGQYPGSARKEGHLSLYVRRDGEFCRISFSDRALLIPEERVREILNLRYVSEWHYMISILHQENLPALSRMILNMQAVYRNGFSADIVSNEQTGTRIQLRYRCA